MPLSLFWKSRPDEPFIEKSKSDSHANKSHFHMKCCAPGLAFIERPTAIRT